MTKNMIIETFSLPPKFKEKLLEFHRIVEQDPRFKKAIQSVDKRFRKRKNSMRYRFAIVFYLHIRKKELANEQAKNNNSEKKDI